LIVVHGDRAEALAGAIGGVTNNIFVAHIEGGELSGTIDGIFRHAISKLADFHFVANKSARNRLLQLGEDESMVYEIGSPDIDVMLSDTLPNLETVKNRYEINFDEYGILLFHPVTNELKTIRNQAREIVDSLQEVNENFIVIRSNNDPGSDYIFREFSKLQGPRFAHIPSMRFEYFLTLLKNAKYIIGNSSAGIREAPIYGVPTIDIGTRQNGRDSGESISNIPAEKSRILDEITNHGT